MPAIVEPPVAPPAASAAAPAIKPNPGEIVLGKPNAPGPDGPRKIGPAREEMFKNLRKQGKIDGPEPTTPIADTKAAAPAPEKPKSSDAVPVSEKAGGEKTNESGNSPSADPIAAKTETPKIDPKKPSPWKLVEQYKSKSITLESENIDLKKRLESLGDPAKIQDRMTTAEKRAQELEEHIRFVDYAKSKEFQEKWQAPYEAAWKRATSELRELSITDPNGQVRQVTPQDLLDLVNLPLGKAREIAESLYGNFANDVLGHRKEIRNLFDQQQEALDSARKNGVESQKKQMEQFQALTAQIETQMNSAWDQTNSKLMEDPEYGKFFKPMDGDEEGNNRLKKGYELADKAFSENPRDPRLSPAQRQEIVKRHAAVRNRAAAAGRLVHWVKQRDARIAELTKELDQYKTSEPGNGAPKSVQPVAANGGGSRSQVFAALRKLGS